MYAQKCCLVPTVGKQAIKRSVYNFFVQLEVLFATGCPGAGLRVFLSGFDHTLAHRWHPECQSDITFL
jgi:hypothetical protein